MKIFEINFESKKSLRRKIGFLEAELKRVIAIKDEVIGYNNELADAYENRLADFPFTLGDAVYEVQLKGANGRYTKTKPSREHSTIVEIAIDEKNYFRLAKKFMNGVFFEKEEAEEYLNEICNEDETIQA